MKPCTRADLLNALSALFDDPVEFDRRVFEEALAAPWAGPDLRGPLAALLEEDPMDLDAAYADHFLHSSWHPVLPLEASLLTEGHLCDEGVVARREALHRRLGVPAPADRCSDHLATGLAVLARVQAPPRGAGPVPDRQAAFRSYLEEQLIPQLARLRSLGQDRPLHPIFSAGMDAAAVLLEGLRPPRD